MVLRNGREETWTDAARGHRLRSGEAVRVPDDSEAVEDRNEDISQESGSRREPAERVRGRGERSNRMQVVLTVVILRVQEAQVRRPI